MYSKRLFALLKKGRTDDGLEMSADNTQSIMVIFLQVVLAILIPFMMIAITHQEKFKAYIEAAKEADILKDYLKAAKEAVADAMEERDKAKKEWAKAQEALDKTEEELKGVEDDLEKAHGALVESEKDLKIAKGAIGVLYGELDDMRNTPRGRLYDERNQAVIGLQWQKILLALEQIENDERRDLGISNFCKKTPGGKIEYLMSDLLYQGKVVNERFKESCIYASNVLSDRQSMVRNWLGRALFIHGMHIKGMDLGQPLIDNPEIVSEKNVERLYREINRRATTIYADCYDMQCKALSHLVQYYGENMDALQEDATIKKQLEEAMTAPDDDRIRLIAQLKIELNRFVRSVFKSQDIPLLEEFMSSS